MKKIITAAILNVMLIVSMFFTVYTNYGGIENYGVVYIFSTGFPFAILFIMTSIVSIIFLLVTIIKNFSAQRHSIVDWLPVALFTVSVIANIILRICLKGKL